MKAMITDLTGQQFGNYRLVRRLGVGGFASVYLGEHKHVSSLQAAIKILDLKDVDVEKFRTEAVIIAKLVHPHILRLLDFDFRQETPFLVLDYAPHSSLRDQHPKGTMVPLATVVRYAKDIASALQYAHEQRIIHRDVKPENILVGRSGEVLLSDFGIAMLSKTGRTSLDVATHKAGTPYYMAPEMIRGKPEKASDQYALGIVVYELLCGTPPFTEGDIFQLGMQHLVEPVPPLREKLSSLSPRVEAVVLKALAKKPEDRFPSVQAFSEALEEVSKVPPTPPKLPKPPIGTRLLIYRGHSDSVMTLAWSPDGSRIASGSIDKTMQIWEVSSGRLLRTYSGHSNAVWTLAWSPDGSRIASGTYVWEVSSGRLLRTYRGHANEVYTLAWSPDGSRIASGSSDKTVQVWEVSSGRLLHTYSGHSEPVYMVAWSPDGSHIASGSEDMTVQVWQGE